jgi:excisionase family DNA binding protein
MSEKLTTKQVAEILGVSTGRVRQMVLGGVLQAERFGQNLAFDMSAVEVAKNRKTKPGPAPAETATHQIADEAEKPEEKSKRLTLKKKAAK